MNVPGGTITDQITMLVEPVLEEMGFELIDVEYFGPGGRRVLRVYMDRPGGVSLDDCARVSREIGVLIDVKDLIPERYVLEVSSPGLNRRLKREKDFAWAMGKKVKVRMKTPVEGRRNFTGRLIEMQEGTIAVEVEKGKAVLPIHGIEKANLVYE
ncbi:MAG TPA: ribosome maturation factor RimP [Desulfobacteraceae bacterium]|nr:ribosome maturation factor RimP [Desulfobacteraceae bacterium]